MAVSDDWLTEGYIEFSLGVSVILLRIFARTKLLGFKKWQGDDYLILLALAAYAIQAYLWKGLRAASFIHFHPGISEHDVNLLVTSLKINLGLWTCNVTYLWCLKGCMVLLYSRLTNGLREHRLVQISGIIVVVTWILSILELYLHCLPLHKLWQVYPNPGKVCSSSITNFTMIGFFNFATDSMLLCVVMPLLYKARLPLKRKLLVSVLLCGGVFIIAATLVRNINGLLQINGMGTKDKSSVMKWAVRELLVATLVVNAPCIKPLFNSQSWIKKHGAHHIDEKPRQPLDWDDAEAQVTQAPPTTTARIGKKQGIRVKQGSVDSNMSGASEDSMAGLFMYRLDKKGKLKKVRFSQMTAHEEPHPSLNTQVFESVSGGIPGGGLVHGENPGEMMARKEQLLPQAPVRLMTVKTVGLPWSP